MARQAVKSEAATQHTLLVQRISRLLRAFPDTDQVLRVRDLTERSGLHKATVSRLLLALEAEGLVQRLAQRGYRSRVRIASQKKVRIGYASQTEDSMFAHEVTSSVQRAASEHDVELIVFDNCYDPATTLQNVERIIAARVDVAIEFQTFESVVQIVSSKFQQARIPLVSVDLPCPGATFFGGDNYRAGTIAGRAVGRWVKHNWPGESCEILLLELPSAGPLPQLRLTGALTGLQEVVPESSEWNVVRLDSGNTFGASRAAVAQHLRSSRTTRFVILAINDPSALGALRAFEEANRDEECVAVGQGATLDARLELRRSASRLIGTVAFFPERYGEALVRLAFDLLERRSLPPAVYTRHKLIDSRNVDRLYPEDA